MKKIFYFKMLKCLSCLCYLIVIFCVGSIILLEFTDLRPLGYAAKAERINTAILNLSYSIVSASIFYLVMEYFPTLSKRQVARKRVSRQLCDIKEQLRIIVQCELLLFSLDNNKSEKFVVEFEKTNLNESSLLNPDITKAQSINDRKECIGNISNNILESYYTVLTMEQSNFLGVVLQSDFLNIVLRPTIWLEDGCSVSDYPDNQKEIGESIYKLYLDSRKIC